MIKPALKVPSSLQVSLFQDAEDENYFIFYEIWFDDYGFENHSNQDHEQRFLNKISPKITEEIVFHKMNRVATKSRVVCMEKAALKN